MDLDINGFLTSTEFLGQLAALIAGLLSTLLTTIINGIFGIQ